MRGGQYSVSAVQRQQKLKSPQLYRQGRPCCAERAVLRQSREQSTSVPTQQALLSTLLPFTHENARPRFAFKHHLEQPLIPIMWPEAHVGQLLSRFMDLLHSLQPNEWDADRKEITLTHQCGYA